VTDTPEQQLAVQVQGDNAGWIVKDYPTKPSQVTKGKTAVSVFRSSILPAANRTGLDHELKVNVFVGPTEGPAAADALREALDGVMLSIERYAGGSFKRADLKVFEDKFLGWDIDVTVTSDNIYRSTVIQERSNNGSAAA